MDKYSIRKIWDERIVKQQEYLGCEKDINHIHPLVSVCVATYQHADYITQTIEGVLSQKTTFPIEIIIGDDGSTDGTTDICKEFAEKNKDRIRLYVRDRDESLIKDGLGNTIVYCNWTWILQESRGKYIAICEGDDYWTDPYKLQKQVDFMESHPDYGLVHTKHKIYLQEEDRFEDLDRSKHTGNIFHQLLFDNEVATLTALVRTDLVRVAIDDNFFCENFVALDYPLWLYIAYHSKVHFIDDITAVYRKLGESASNSRDEIKSYKFIIGIIDIKIYFAEKFGCFDLILDYVSRYKKRNLKYGYLRGNKEISKQAYSFLKKYNKLNLKDRIFYYSTIFPIIRFLAKFVAGLKNRG